MPDSLVLGMCVRTDHERESPSCERLPPLQQQLQEVSRSGIRVVGFHPRWPQQPDPGPSVAVCRELGLRVDAVHGPWWGDSYDEEMFDLAGLDEAVRLHSVEQVPRSIAYTVAVGARDLVLHPGVKEGPDRLDERYDALKRSIEALLPDVERAEVRLCFENLPWPGPGERMERLAPVIASFDNSHVGLCLDTGHANVTENVPDAIRAAGRFLFTTHVHDNDGSGDQHLNPGQAAIAWDDVATALAEIGYRGPIILECISSFGLGEPFLTPDYVAWLERFCRRAAGG